MPQKEVSLKLKLNYYQKVPKQEKIFTKFCRTYTVDTI